MAKKRGRPKKTRKQLSKGEALRIQKQRPHKEQVRDARSTSKSLKTDDRWKKNPLAHDYPEVDTRSFGVTREVADQIEEDQKELIFLENIIKAQRKDRTTLDNLSRYQRTRLASFYKIKGRSGMSKDQLTKILKEKIREDAKKIRTTQQTLRDLRLVKVETPSDKKVKKELIDQIIKEEKEFSRIVDQWVDETRNRLGFLNNLVQTKQQNVNNANPGARRSLETSLVRAENKERVFIVRFQALSLMAAEATYSQQLKKANRTRIIRDFEKGLENSTINELRVEKLKRVRFHQYLQNEYKIANRKEAIATREDWINFNQFDPQSRQGKIELRLLNEDREDLAALQESKNVLQKELNKLSKVPIKADLLKVTPKRTRRIQAEDAQSRKLQIKQLILFEKEFERVYREQASEISDRFGREVNNVFRLEAELRRGKLTRKQSRAKERQLQKAYRDREIAHKGLDAVQAVYKRNQYRRGGIEETPEERKVRITKWEDNLQKLPLKELQFLNRKQAIDSDKDQLNIDLAIVQEQIKQQQRYVKFLKSGDFVRLGDIQQTTIDREEKKIGILQKKLVQDKKRGERFIREQQELFLEFKKPI